MEKKNNFVGNFVAYLLSKKLTFKLECFRGSIIIRDNLFTLSHLKTANCKGWVSSGRNLFLPYIWKKQEEIGFFGKKLEESGKNPQQDKAIQGCIHNNVNTTVK